eukprot:Gb_10171 [translate_table: standard]
MPTFSAITIDRFIEPRDSNPCSKEEKRNPLTDGKGIPSRAFGSPTLYTTPQTTPLPYIAPSFTSSPYVINHKRRAPPPRVTEKVEPKAASQQNGFTVVTKAPDSKPKEENNTKNEIKCVLKEINSNCKEMGEKTPVIEEEDTLKTFLTPREAIVECLPSAHNDEENVVRLDRIRKIPISGWSKIKSCEQSEHYEQNVAEEDAEEMFQRSPGDIDYTPRTNRSDFFDAEDDLSAEDAALQTSESSNSRKEDELDVLRSKISMEIERSARAEEALSLWQNQWREIVQKLSLVGLSLPSMEIDAEPQRETAGIVNYIDNVCAQLTVARTVADAVGRGSSRAELEQEMKGYRATCLLRGSGGNIASLEAIYCLPFACLLKFVMMSIFMSREFLLLPLDAGEVILALVGMVSLAIFAFPYARLLPCLNAQHRCEAQPESKLNAAFCMYLAEQRMAWWKHLSMWLRRRIQKRRQQWIWSSLAISFAIGTTALAYSYFPVNEMKDWMPSMCTESDNYGTAPDRVDV